MGKAAQWDWRDLLNHVKHTARRMFLIAILFIYISLLIKLTSDYTAVVR